MPIHRRSVFAAAAVGVAAGPAAAAGKSPRATFVLVHGAWNGGWCWKRVRRLLQDQGHEVFTPTLTGLADRSHLLSKDITLDTHIHDVANLLRWEELGNVVLCGHSYGGAVIAGAAEVEPARVGALVYLDAYVLKDGQSLYDALPAQTRDIQVARANRMGEGWRVPPIPAEAFAVNPADRAWVDRQATFHPMATNLQPLRLTGAADRVKDISYILARGWAGSPFPPFYDAAKARGWHAVAIDSGHDMMLDHPDALAAELLKVARRIA